MKKILTILLTIISINLLAVEPVGFQYDFYDTLRFRKPFILQNGDTCSIFLVNDSICMKCNSGDTVRIDGTTVDLSNYPDRTELGDTANAVETRAKNYADIKVGEIDSIAEVASDDTLNIHVGLQTYKVILNPGSGSGPSIDSLQSFKQAKDTIRMGCFSNPYDTIHISRPLTIFIDTTGAYGYEGTTTLYFNGQGTYGGDSVTWSTNADIFNIKYNADSLWRASLKGNYCIIYQGRPTPYRFISIICDTFTYPSDDIIAPYMLSFEVGNINDSLIVGIASEELNSDSIPNFIRDSIYHKFAYGTDTIYSDSVYVNSDTIFYMMPYALSADSTIKTYYIKPDSAGYEDLANNKLASFSDSLVTNNVTSATAIELLRNKFMYYTSSDETTFGVTSAPLLDSWTDTINLIAASATGTDRPDTATIGGYMAVDFEQGNSEYLATGGFYTNGGVAHDSLMVIAVIKREDQPTGVRGGLISKWGVDPDRAFRIAYGGAPGTDESFIVIRTASGVASATFAMTPSTDIQIVSWVIQKTTAKFFVNGVQTGGDQTLTYSGITDSNGTTMYIAESHNNTSWNFDGAIYIIVGAVNGNLTEHTNVVNQLKTEFGIE